MLAGNRHVVCTESWLSLTPPNTPDDSFQAMRICAQRLRFPFGFPSTEGWDFPVRYSEQIWPKPGAVLGPIDVFPGLLNLNAPEASFRLQRVGASGKLGLVRLPILDDATFVDPPHRRRIDVSVWGPALAANMGTASQSVTWNGRTYQNVIYDRFDQSWENVVGYQLQPSTCRVWQRNTIYDIHRLPADSAWVVNEPDNYPAGR